MYCTALRSRNRPGTVHPRTGGRGNQKCVKAVFILQKPRDFGRKDTKERHQELLLERLSLGQRALRKIRWQISGSMVIAGLVMALSVMTWCLQRMKLESSAEPARHCRTYILHRHRQHPGMDNVQPRLFIDVRFESSHRVPLTVGWAICAIGMVSRQMVL